MLIPFKPTSAMLADACVDKLVLSAWPQFRDGHYVTTICNVAIVVSLAETSLARLPGIDLLIESRYLAGRSAIRDITHTLLDASNPLSYTTQGAYRRDPGSDVLPRYDGLADVRAATGCAVSIARAARGPFHRVHVEFDRPVRPGGRRAVRFCFAAGGFFAAAPDGQLRFRLAFASDHPLGQFEDLTALRALEMPILNALAEGSAGGLDVFLFMPLEFDGEEFSSPPFHSLLPDYDHFGRQISPPRVKFAWPGVLLRPTPGALLIAGDNVTLHGHFRRRILMSAPHIEHLTLNGDGSVFFAPVTHSAVGAQAHAISVEDKDTARLILEQLHQLLASAEPGPSTALAQLHLSGVDEAVAAGRWDTVARRLQPLADAVAGIAEMSAPALDLIQRITDLL